MMLATAFNYFANSLWQVPLLAFCCWCAMRLLRASARLQYAAWVLTLLLATALPLRGITPARVDLDLQTSGEAELPAFVHPVPLPPLPFYAVEISPQTRDRLAEVYLWLTAFALLRLLASHLALRRLLRASTSYLTPKGGRGREAWLPSGTDVRLLPPSHATPMVAGVVRPALLLPAALLAGEPEALQAVLAHELEHVRRRDTLTNLLLHLTTLPIAYHPATTFLHRRLQHARELLCDAVAAGAMPSPGAYAQVLLSLAQQLLVPGGDASHSSVGLFERTSKPLLEDRIMNLIAPPTPLGAASRSIRLTAAATLFAVAAFAACSLHLTPTVRAAVRVANPQASISAPAAPQPQPAQAAASANEPSIKPPVHGKSALQQAETELKAAEDELGSAQVQLDLQQAVQTKVETTQIQKQIEELRKQISSPEFKREIALAAAQAAAAARESESYRKQVDALRKQLGKQLGSPEFRQMVQAQTAEAMRVNGPREAQIKQEIAEARAALLPLTASPGAPVAQQPGPARVSGGVMAGQVLTKVPPVYPPDAKAAGISGAVVLHAVIGKDGTIDKLEVISGPQVLQSSALEAVRQWTYKPYLLNGEPTEVETTITVTYSFGQ